MRELPPWLRRCISRGAGGYARWLRAVVTRGGYMAVTHLQPESSCGSYMVVTGGLHGGYTPAAREQLRQPADLSDCRIGRGLTSRIFG